MVSDELFGRLEFEEEYGYYSNKIICQGKEITINLDPDSTNSITEMLEIAKQSEHPRAFEVVSTLMKTVLDANKDFADMSSKKRFVKEEINGPKEAAQTNVTNNNLIVSTADLLKMIKGDNEDG